MAYSFQNFSGDGVNRNFSVPFDYLEQEHVLVSVDGLDANFIFLNPNTIQTATAPDTDAVVKVYRDTPKSEPLVSFNNGSTQTANDLNTANLQTLYIVQEAYDAYSLSDIDPSVIAGLDDAARDAVITQNLTDGLTSRSPSSDAVFDALALKSNASHTHNPAATGAAGFMSAADKVKLDSIADSAVSAAGARTAVVDDSITDGVTTRAPSQNAVHDALGVKVNTDLTNLSNSVFAAKAAASGVGGSGAGVYDGIRDGVTATAPTENAVYDAISTLATKNLQNVTAGDYMTAMRANGGIVRKGRLHIDPYVSSDESIDTASGFANAIADLNAAGGGEILLGSRNYVMNSGISIAYDNISIKGVSPNTSVITLNGSASSQPFYWYGAGGVASYTLSANIAARSQIVYLSGTSGLSYGDTVYIALTTPLGGLLTVFARIVYVNPGLYIALDRDVPFAVGTGSTYQVTKVSLRQGGGLNSVMLNGYSATHSAAKGIHTAWTTGMKFHDINYQGWSMGSGAGCYPTFGFENEYTGTHRLKQCGSYNVSDFMPYAETGGVYGRIHSVTAAGFGPQWQWCTHGTVDEVRIYRSANRNMKVQGCRSMTFGRIHSYFANSVALGLSYNSAYNHFQSVHLTHQGEVGGNSVGLWFSDQGSCSNKFSLVESYGAAEYEVAFFGSDQRNWIGHLAYSGNGSKLLDASGTNTIQSTSVVP